MLVSVVGDIQTYKRCHYRWSLTAIDQGNLEPASFTPALELGSMVHEAVAWWTEHPVVMSGMDNDREAIVPSSLPRYFARLSKGRIEKIKAKYVEDVGAEASEDELDKVYEITQLGLAMMENYQKKYGRPLPAEYTPVQVEQRTIVAIPNTLHWGCPSCYWDFMPLMTPEDQAESPEQWGEGDFFCPKCRTQCEWVHHFLRGTMDTFVVDSQGKYYVLERKTYAIRPTKQKLNVDEQMTSYVWILAQLFGYENVGGVLYDGLWKKAIIPKTVDKRKGEFDDLFFRDVFVRRPAALKRFEEELPGVVNDMCTAAYEKRLYTNRRWEGCYDCGVARICDAYMQGEDIDYVIESYYRPRPSDSDPASGAPDQVDE